MQSEFQKASSGRYDVDEDDDEDDVDEDVEGLRILTGADISFSVSPRDEKEDVEIE
jgi:hypothetical protein